MKIAILSDAWAPQTSGVVTTLTKMVDGLAASGHEVRVIHPGLFRTLPCPSYPEIRLALFPGRRIARMLDEWRPDAVHLVIEGPIGIAGRNYCVRRGIPFTTCFTTKFPEYVQMRFGVPASLTYRAIRWFHRKAARVFVATPSLETELREHGFENEFARWGRGVDTELFRPLARDDIDAERPILGYLGRVAVEKNIEAFLDLDVPGTKVVLGGGPALESLRTRYPDVRFFGMLPQARLPGLLSALDVFVFPSRTDTFGIVMIEANACGTPVAAYPVVGPVDVVEEGTNGALDEDLAAAVMRALKLDRAACREFALRHTWARSVEQFEAGLVRIPRGAEAASGAGTQERPHPGGVPAGR